MRYGIWNTVWGAREILRAAHILRLCLPISYEGISSSLARVRNLVYRPIHPILTVPVEP